MSTSTADWPVYTLGLKERHPVAERTLAFGFEKPAGMTFKAGQFMDVTWLEPTETDAEGNTRGFSITAAPDDPDLTFATRLRDTAFKRYLQQAPLGAKAKVEGPFGNLTLHNKSSRPAVLLAGGIGITPFRSIVRRAAHEKLPHRIYLFYANRRVEDAAFLAELQGLTKENPNFTFIPTITRPDLAKTPWNGETGRIDSTMITKYLKNMKAPEGSVADPVYYIAGPAAMVHGLHAMLNSSGIDDDDIRLEEFAGY